MHRRGVFECLTSQRSTGFASHRGNNALHFELGRRRDGPRIGVKLSAMSAWVLASNSEIHLEDITPELATSSRRSDVRSGVFYCLFLRFVTRPREVGGGSRRRWSLRRRAAGHWSTTVEPLVTRENHGVAGTLLDLAGRALLDIDERRDGTYFSAGREPPDRLLPHERMLDDVVRLAGGGSVPSQALTTGLCAGQSANWLRRFDKLVTQDGRSRRASIVPRFGIKEWGIVRMYGARRRGSRNCNGGAGKRNQKVGFFARGMALRVLHAALRRSSGRRS